MKWIAKWWRRLRAGGLWLEEDTGEIGDGIVTRARAAGFGAGLPTDADAMTVDGPPFKHDYAAAPLMIDVSGVVCEHPECAAPAEPRFRIVTPFGYPVVCKRHAIELIIAWLLPEPTDAEREAAAWIREALREGPNRHDRRLEWLAAGKPRENAGADVLDWPAGRRDARL